MPRVRKRKYKKHVDGKSVENQRKFSKITLSKLIEKGNELQDCIISKKKIMILASYMLTPVIIIWGIISLSIPKEAIDYIKYFLLVFCTFPLMIHYLYLILETKPNGKIPFFSKLWSYLKKLPFDFLIVIVIFIYITTSSNKAINDWIKVLIMFFLSYKISQFIIFMTGTIKKSFQDKEQFKMYMELTNKILLSIITIIGSILTILLTIKQLLS